MARATGGFFDEPEYRVLRAEMRKNATLFAKLPDFLRTCSDLSQYWSFIQKLFPSYQERRDYLWEAFAPAIDYLETKVSGLVVTPDREMLAQFNAQGVHIAWDKALNRRNDDPEGAITAARHSSRPSASTSSTMRASPTDRPTTSRTSGIAPPRC